MLDRGGVELMCSILKPDMDVLEYGSGGSSTFFWWWDYEIMSFPILLLLKQVMALFSSQSICQKLDKHGAWQQLGTKGVMFSSKKLCFDIFEGEKHLEYVTMGR